MGWKPDDNALQILKLRYFDGDEDYEGMCRRVAGGNEDFIALMMEGRFLPNSPALFNMGTKSGGTSSACFVFEIQDTMLGDRPGEVDLDSIVGTRAKAAAVAKAGGGVGYYLGHLRRKGAVVNSVHRRACGPVAVLRDKNSLRQLITQGGKRDLAQMGILPCDHPDIREFIHVKDDDPQSLSSFNISVSWFNEWLKRVNFVPGPGFVGGAGKETELWWEQCYSAWKTGDPGVFFPDTANWHNPNPHLGLLRATNPCGEVPLRNNEPCNLGSLSLPRYWKKGERGRRGVDFDRLARDAATATRFLNDILDRNTFPHPDITAAALLTRKLGLGVMGWADLLALLHIHYDTDEAVELADHVMRCVNYAAGEASSQLAHERGPYPGYGDKTDSMPYHNETRTCIAPTGTIAIIAGVMGSIEPHFALEWERTTNEGLKLTERISCHADLDGFVPKTASEIDWRWHVKHQAAFQRHTDLAVSKTINLPNKATVQDISDAYEMMWRTGCKGGTVFRDGCRDEQVLVAKKATSVYTTGLKADLPAREKLPATRQSLTHKFRVGETKCYLTVGMFPDGRPGEIFLRASRQGSTVGGLLDTWAMTFSNALQHGMPLEELIDMHEGSRFEPDGLTDDKDIPSCSSIPDYVVRWLELRFLAAKDKGPRESGQLCPDCGGVLVSQAGCLTCTGSGCGWTRCG